MMRCVRLQGNNTHCHFPGSARYSLWIPGQLFSEIRCTTRPTKYEIDFSDSDPKGPSYGLGNNISTDAHVLFWFTSIDLVLVLVVMFPNPIIKRHGAWMARAKEILRPARVGTGYRGVWGDRSRNR